MTNHRSYFTCNRSFRHAKAHELQLEKIIRSGCCQLSELALILYCAHTGCLITYTKKNKKQPSAMVYFNSSHWLIFNLYHW